VANSFTADESLADVTVLRLSNGATDVFFDVLTLAGCALTAGAPEPRALAQVAWEQHLVLHFADGHRLGMGNAGFDLSQLPWTPGWRAEKAFFVRMIRAARRRQDWDRLPYRPQYAAASLATYRAMLAGFTPVPVTDPAWGDWRIPPAAQLLARCPDHDIYQGELGCRLCDPSSQPIR
jgi:hypothetical protein